MTASVAARFRSMTGYLSHGPKPPATDQQVPRVRIVTMPQLLSGKRPRMPLTLLPYISAPHRAAESGQLSLDGE